MRLPSQLGPQPLDLPAPDPAASAHSARLRDALHTEIVAAGAPGIPFARFMEQALYAPGLGYYSAGTRKFGREGDFITAPELSPLFGRCLARQLIPLLAQLPGGEVLEVGAGSGVLAADLLGELHTLGALPARYLILERSAELRARQQARLAEAPIALRERVQWLDDLPPPGWQGVVVANELLDALPVHRFVRGTDGETAELYVDWADGRFVWRAGPWSDPRLAEQLAAVEAEAGALPAGYVSELAPAVGDWLRALAERLGRGAVLLFDYGYSRREYYLPERSGGTLTCHYRHRVHGDPLILPGLQDITAYVDFTAAAEAAHAAGLAVAGYTTQAHFLLGAGLLELAQLDALDAVERTHRAQQIKTLTLPGEMGERFKVLALARDLDLALPSLRLADMRARL
ncbi:SAM-dependent methyltransferase [Ectothiorhodospiraceae bacterium 2226]|nr:SAM-dependent methyltransferase [Ectothiorhodospiraceae bacterium 2226]